MATPATSAATPVTPSNLPKEYKQFIVIAVYFGLLVIFAGLYSTIFRDQFFQSAIKHERAYLDAIANVRESLLEDFDSSKRKNHRFETPEGHLFDSGAVNREILSLDNSSGTVTFWVAFGREAASRGKPWNLPPCRGRLSFNIRSIIEDGILLLPDDGFSGPEYLIHLFDHHAITSREGERKGWVIVPSQRTKDLHETINQAEHGHAPKKGSFLRMLYFSAATITTVGFGDIVPTTNTVRAVVALEAILGIILIGTFVNLIQV
jgi:hypothetical protein